MKRSVWFVAGLLTCVSIAEAKQMTAGELDEDGKAGQRIEDGRGTQQDAIPAGRWIGYIAGVRDMGIASSTLCISANHDTSGEQQYATVLLYLDQHPQRWHEPAWKLTLEALRQVFPCQQH